MADILSIFRNNPVLKNCSEECLVKLLQGTNFFRVQEGQNLFKINEPAQYIYILSFGSIKLMKQNAEGRETIISFLRAGDFVGAGVVSSVPTNYPVTAVAHEDCGLVKIPKNRYLDIWMKNPEISGLLHQHLMSRMVDFHSEKAEITLSVPKKIASFLLRTLDQQPPHFGSVITLPLTRKDIADRVGTSVETSIRVLSEWSHKNVIKTCDGRIQILNREYLDNVISSD